MTTPKDFDFANLISGLEAEGLAGRVADIDTLIAVADRHDCWSEEFEATALEQAKKQAIRHALRKGVVDENGERHRFLCIEEFDPESKEPKLGYKQIAMFTLDNFEWAIKDRLRRISNEKTELDNLLKMVRKRFGKQGLRKIQRRLNLDFSEPEPAAAS